MQTIGDRIRNMRVNKGLSQGDLAKLTDTHRTTINSIERNGENVTAVKLKAISTALGCSMNHLLTGEEDKPISIAHIFGERIPAVNYDNLVEVPKDLHMLYEGIIQYLCLSNRSSFMKEVPHLLERSFKLAHQKLDAVEILLPSSTDAETMHKWIDDYTDVYASILKQSVLECFGVNL